MRSDFLPNRTRRRPALVAAAVTTLLSLGCIPPEAAVRSADKSAYDIVEQKQLAALGRTEPFTIERPEDELRRRLMLDQKLPAAGAASYGRAYLPPVRKEPKGVSPNLALPQGAQVVEGPKANVEGETTETFATDVFLYQLGRDPAAKRVTPLTPPGTGIALGPPTPEESAPPPLVLTIVDALHVGARNNRQYQSQKEQVYLTALALDLERDRFEFRFAGTLDADLIQDQGTDPDRTGLLVTPAVGINKAFKTGAVLSTRIGVDIANLLSGDRDNSIGLLADASLTIPLLQGAGVEIVTEPLHQAERDAIYAIWQFERFKREFAVDVTQRYYNVLQQLDQITNARATYDRLRANSERSRALFEQGRLPAVQVDQVVSNQLSAFTRVILAEQRFEQALDSYKVFLGLPADARVQLDPEELASLTPLATRVLGPDFNVEATDGEIEAAADPTTQPGPTSRPATNPTTGPTTDAAAPPATAPADNEDAVVDEAADPEDIERRLGEEGNLADAPTDIDDPTGRYSQIDVEYRDEAIRLALTNRLDLAITYGEVADAQRQTVLAADGLNAVFDLVANADASDRRGTFSGSAENARLRFDEAIYSLGIRFDLPIERTAERNQYRQSLIALDRSIRDAQEAEDGVKLDVLEGLRNLRVAAEQLRVQALSIEVARRRVESANQFFDLGRGEIRDITEANDDLVNAQDDFTSALVDFRIAELELQRDMGVLSVNATGLYRDAGLFDFPTQ